MKNLLKFEGFITEGWQNVNSSPFHDMEQQDSRNLPEEKIEVAQDDWEDWKYKLKPGMDYSSCEIYINDDESTITINSPTFKFEDEYAIMIRYTKQSQKDPQLEAKLEKAKSDGVIKRFHFMTLVNPEAFITHLGNLKCVTRRSE
jgi:hypothetical protein